MTTLRNFSNPLDDAKVTRMVIRNPAPMVVDTLTVTPVRAPSRSDLLCDGDWGWEQLRDYVIAQVTKRFPPPPPRNAIKEKAIFSAFAERHGPDAERIARFAFEIEDGRWRSAPVTVHRFCKNSDPIFAVPILARLAAITP